MKDQISSLYEYGDWVTTAQLEAAAGLTEAQFGQKVLPSFGSLHLTLAHQLGAEIIWLARAQGQSPKAMLTPEAVPNVPALRARWAALMSERQAYFAALTEADLAAPMAWSNMRGQPYTLPLWQVLLHCANHSTHHRSEVAAILTELGHEPASSDLLEFYLARAGQPWKPTGRT